jgi:hypothetical protein
MTILQKVGIRWKFLTAEKFDGRNLPFFYRHFHHFPQNSNLQKGQNCAISVKKETKIAKEFCACGGRMLYYVIVVER